MWRDQAERRAPFRYLAPRAAGLPAPPDRCQPEGLWFATLAPVVRPGVGSDHRKQQEQRRKRQEMQRRVPGSQAKNEDAALGAKDSSSAGGHGRTDNRPAPKTCKLAPGLTETSSSIPAFPGFRIHESNRTLASAIRQARSHVGGKLLHKQLLESYSLLLELKKCLRGSRLRDPIPCLPE